jgi:hypothetical protein
MKGRHLATKVLGWIIVVSGWPAAAAAATPPWKDAEATVAQAADARRWIRPTQARTFRLDTPAVQALARRVEANPARDWVLNLPLPDGRSVDFRLRPTQVMAPALAAQVPQIKTFAGVVVGDASISGRFDVGPRGFHGQIFTPQGTVFIDPYLRGELRLHQAYFTRDMPARRRAPDVVYPMPDAAPVADRPSQAASPTSLYTYRLAMATTGEYAAFQDPDHTPPDKNIVLAELVNLVNRVSGVYEREVGIRLQLVGNNQRVIFVDAATDPYANDAGTDVGVNTGVLNMKLGFPSYDVGHVVGTGQGGVGYLGVVCNSSYKGNGATGLPEPVGDPFYIDYVAHELGHQFNANHTFNGQAKNCLANRAAGTAYEPGSGSTIMAYAGICAEDDLQPHSDDVFHAANFDEIVTFTRNGTGAVCAKASGLGNQVPTAAVPAGGFTIPVSTPFELTGSGADADGDPLTYQWEQFDLGAQGAPDAPDGTAPLFRSFLPTMSPTRVFPQPSDLLGNVHTLGEILPAVSRTLNFRFTVRDQRFAPSFGGVASANLSFQVTDQAGPFKVLAPNTAGRIKRGAAFTVRWDPAGTTAPPVSCSRVDILASNDGGLSFPLVLKSGAANNGASKVRAPTVMTDHARVKVKCSDNVFFDVSDADFSVY